MTTPSTHTPTSSPRFTIRPANTTDRAEVDRLYDICRLTGKDGQDATGATTVPRLLGEVYLGAYLAYEPDLAFVLVDETVDGPEGVVGYVLGARDTVAFDALLERDWWPRLREEYPLGTFPEESFDAGLVRTIHRPAVADPAIVGPYPAHLHVDLLPAGQGGGNGRRLMETLFDALRDLRVAGVHLGVSLTNDHAIGFYRHLGFRDVGDGGWQFGLDLRATA